MEGFWKILSAKESQEFKDWARLIDMDEVFEVSPLWHPVVRLEIAKMIIEKAGSGLKELNKDKPIYSTIRKGVGGSRQCECGEYMENDSGKWVCRFCKEKLQDWLEK